MKTLYSGYYGAKNSGDDAFVEVSSWGSEKFWGCTNHLFFAESIPQISTKVSYFGAHKNHLNFTRGVYQILKSDVFVSAGGSTFHSGLTITDLRTYAKLKKRIGFKGQTGAIGISLGPYTSATAEKNTIKYLKTLDFLALRDSKSYEVATSYNLPYKPVKAFDLAALLPEIYEIKSSNRNVSKIVGISICNYETYTNGDLNNENRRNIFISSLLKVLAEDKDIVFRFFIFNGNEIVGDKFLTLKTISEIEKEISFNYEIVNYSPDVQSIYRKIGECSLVISTRLHASIFACYANVPFFLLEYHRKCTDFLFDVGQHEKYRVYDGDISPIECAAVVFDILENNNYLAPLNVEETKERALLNFTATYNKR